MGRTCSNNRDNRNYYRLIVVRSEGNRPVGKQRGWWMGNINTDLGEIVWFGQD
jgi:hypothetical protein